MKKSIKKQIFLILITLFLIACSNSSNDECNDILEPNTNEFTANCNRYPTNLAYYYIQNNAYDGKVSCRIIFTNQPDGVVQNFSVGMQNITFADFWLKLPESAIISNEIEPGEYSLSNQKLVNWSRLYTNTSIISSNTSNNGTVYYYDSNNGINSITSESDDITIQVIKNNNVYEFNYIKTLNGKTIKGNYIGEITMSPTPLFQ